MSKFLFDFWLPVLVLLLIVHPAAAGAWLLVPVVVVPLWLLYCLLAGD